MSAREREIRDAMMSARTTLIHAWSMRGDPASSAECILTALADVQNVLDVLEEPSAVTETRTAGDDEPSEITALARSMQQRRHGGAS